MNVSRLVVTGIVPFVALAYLNSRSEFKLSKNKNLLFILEEEIKREKKETE